MNPDYLIKCARFKYKTPLDKGEWEAPDAQCEDILALRAEIDGLKRVKKPYHDKKTISRRKKNKRGRTMTVRRQRPKRNATTLGRSLRRKVKIPSHSPNCIKLIIGDQPRLVPPRAMDVIGGSTTNRANARG